MGMTNTEKIDFSISSLGSAELETPLETVFTEPDSSVVYSTDIREIQEQIRRFGLPLSMECAGPRRRIFFNPLKTRAAVLTAGGLCPGLNDVIKGLVNALSNLYGVPEIFGIRYGYRGLIPKYGDEAMKLSPDTVDEIHTEGGTVLGSSRGPQDIGEMVDYIESMKIDILFCIGGDGTLRCAHLLSEESTRRKMSLSIIGIPKTIDNDIDFLDRSFGFETAVYNTDPVVNAAHNEAKGALNGVGLIRVMGRDSGFVAAYATLANSNVNYCLVPEIKFRLNGKGALLPHLIDRLKKKRHAVIIVAEGAGQHLFTSREMKKDKSGNLVHEDIGPFMKRKILEYAEKKRFPVSVKYLDPSYLIRGLQANGTDAVFCLHLAQCAVHAAMSGRTDMVVGHWNGHFTHVPLVLATKKRKKIDVKSPIWRSVMETTNQPDFR